MENEKRPRRSERFEQKLPVKVTIFREGRRSTITGEGCDFSKGGMRLFLTLGLDAGAPLLLEFVLPYTSTPIVVRGDAICTAGAPNHQQQRPDPAMASGIPPASRMRRTRDSHSCTCLIENLRNYSFTKKISLSFASCRVIRDIKPHLQNIAGRYTVAFHGRAEDCLRVLGNSHEYIWLLTGSF